MGTFAVPTLADFAFVVFDRDGEPNESAAALGFEVLFEAVGGDWALRGVATNTDARRSETIDGCTTDSA